MVLPLTTRHHMSFSSSRTFPKKRKTEISIFKLPYSMASLTWTLKLKALRHWRHQTENPRPVPIPTLFGSSVPSPRETFFLGKCPVAALDILLRLGYEKWDANERTHIVLRSFHLSHRIFSFPHLSKEKELRKIEDPDPACARTGWVSYPPKKVEERTSFVAYLPRVATSANNFTLLRPPDFDAIQNRPGTTSKQSYHSHKETQLSSFHDASNSTMIGFLMLSKWDVFRKTCQKWINNIKGTPGYENNLIFIW